MGGRYRILLQFCNVFLVMVILPSCALFPDWLGGEQEKKLKGERIPITQFNNDRVNNNRAGQVTDAKIAIEDSEREVKLPIAKKFNEASTGQVIAGRNHKLSFDAGGGASMPNIQKYSFGDSANKGVFLSSSPVVAGGMIYNLDGRGNIYARKIGDFGKVIWQIKLEELLGQKFIGGNISYDDGVIYASSKGNFLLAIDATNGSVKWRKSLPFPILSPLAITDAGLYFTDSQNSLYGLHKADGEIKFRQENLASGIFPYNIVAPVTIGNNIITLMNDGEVTASNEESGEITMSRNVASNFFDGFYLSGKSFKSDMFLAIDKTEEGGSRADKWQLIVNYNNSLKLLNLLGGNSVLNYGAGASDEDAYVDSGTIIDFQGQVSEVFNKKLYLKTGVAIAKNFLFAIDDESNLLAINRGGGNLKWKTPLKKHEDVMLSWGGKNKGEQIFWNTPIMVNNKIMLVASNGMVNIIDVNSGKILQEYKLNMAQIYLPPVIIDGVVYIMNNNSDLVIMK